MKVFPDYSEKLGEFGVHDPSVIKDKGNYYTISTHGFYQFRVSSDLIHWVDEKKSCFDNTSIKRELSEGIKYCNVEVPISRSEGSPFWAPDIIKIGGKYYMYYSISSFGSTLSYIGLCKSKDLFGEYCQVGCVVKSKGGGRVDLPNAIDPCVRVDKVGKLWMSYGSFFGGIYIVELNKSSGLTKKKNDIGHHIAGGKMAPVEGSYIIYNKQTGYYYLFLSFGGLTDSYNIRVARSKKINGPYLDPNNRLMTDSDWDNLGGMILANYHFSHQKDTYTAPGHNSVLVDNNNFYLIHHTRLNCKVDKHYLNVRKMYFNRLGWPVVIPNRYYKDKLYLSNKNINGMYNIILFKHLTSNKTNESTKVKIELNKNLKKSHQYIEFIYDNDVYYGVIAEGFDNYLESKTLQFSAMNTSGETIVGIKVK